jgi:beta-N-acetylhexosaminidase
VIEDVIRGEIGFDGFLVSDDLDMDALAGYGDISARACASIGAGCDAALHCSGKLTEMQALAKVVPKLSDVARMRLQRGAKVSNIKA